MSANEGTGVDRVCVKVALIKTSFLPGIVSELIIGTGGVMAEKVLVIGSQGNVGKPLVKYLRSMGNHVMETDVKPGWRENYLMADICSPIDLLPAFDWKPDIVYFLAAMVSRVTSEQAAGLTMERNLVGLNNVIQLCKRVNAMMVFFSTSEVYGPDCIVMDEADTDPKPNNRYGFTKLLGEQIVRYEVEQYGLHASILRPFMIYDENEDIGDHRSAMIRFATNLAMGRKIEVHQNSARGWFHISDAIRAIEAAGHVNDFNVFNIGHPDVRPIQDLAEMIRGELGADKNLVIQKNIPDQMTLVKRPKLERMQNILKIVPEVTLEEGVRRVCNRIRDRINDNLV